MKNLNTQDQAKEDVKVNSDSNANMETSNNKNSSIEIDRLNEKIDKQSQNIEELIKHRISETQKVPKVEDITKSIIEDSIVDPDKAGKNLANFVVSETQKAKQEAMLAFKVEQEASSAITAVIADEPRLGALVDDIKSRAANLIHSNRSLSIKDAISQSAQTYKEVLGEVKKEEVKNDTDSNEATAGHLGKTTGNATIKKQSDVPITLEQEIASREETRLAKLNI